MNLVAYYTYIHHRTMFDRPECKGVDLWCNHFVPCTTFCRWPILIFPSEFYSYKQIYPPNSYFSSNFFLRILFSVYTYVAKFSSKFYFYNKFSLLFRSIPVTFCMINRQFMQEVIADAFVIAIISYVINISQAKLFARKSGYDLHSNQVCGDTSTHVRTYIRMCGHVWWDPLT